MAIGPVQLLVFGFGQTEPTGKVAAELERLAAADILRVIDAIVVRKLEDEDEVEVFQFSGLTLAEAEEFGATVGALIGLGAEGEEGLEEGAILGAEEMDRRGGHALDAGAWDVLGDIPAGTAAAVLLVEHRWAIPFRDAIADAGGMPLGDAWITAPDLIAIGVLAREGAEAQSAR